MSERFSIKKRFRSFKFALNGIKILLKEEHNARIHLLAAIGVVLAGVYFSLSPIEWVAVLLCIGFVFAMELLNSAIEALADLVSSEHWVLIKKAKDMAAAAVLVAALVAFVVGLLIFLPKLIS
ncbi:diacylglycerol kinase family protein [Carboxylicivirga sediminis]|uniref:Diacylglycerol kinase family protein n=1 Tax=Carboxylicivirga sediminis TaxID=2006564 RepID=A0A941IYP8_9BACT|nr:diacylglycerol kinase family protein [Carboxylicivirga sediminis]MBR8536818.1 diacylglycerol kinase family protein [Carboxylicivirga sediminis]